MIDKKVFVDSIKDLKRCYEFGIEIDRIGMKFNTELTYGSPDCSNTVIKLISMCFAENDHVIAYTITNFISWWCYECDFGNYDAVYNNIQINTIDELYEFIKAYILHDI